MGPSDEITCPSVADANKTSATVPAAASTIARKYGSHDPRAIAGRLLPPASVVRCAGSCVRSNMMLRAGMLPPKTLGVKGRPTRRHAHRVRRDEKTGRANGVPYRTPALSRFRDSLRPTQRRSRTTARRASRHLRYRKLAHRDHNRNAVIDQLDDTTATHIVRLGQAPRSHSLEEMLAFGTRAV